MFRLVAYAPDGVRRFPVHRSEMLIGSGSNCEVRLPYTGVARAHARLRLAGEELRIEDLGSRKGVLVSGRRIRESALEVLDEVRLGSVTLLVEETTPEEPPEDSGLAEPEPESPAEPLSPEGMLAHLADISNWVLADTESRTPLESLVGELLRDFGGGALFLLHGEADKDPGIKFVTASQPAWLAAGEELLDQVRPRLAEESTDPESLGELKGQLGGEPCWIGFRAFHAVERPYVLVVALPAFEVERWSPTSALRGLSDLLVLGLVHHVGWYEPILPGQQTQRDLTLDPGLMMGHSARMEALLDRLRLAVDPEVNVLLQGEEGVRKDLYARSLHLSSERRNGPFVAASCAGASSAIVEADLFGAVIEGKGEPVRREGKLLLADGGTLYLSDVEALPLDLQGRLVRFLRSGEVEPAGSRSVETSDVRLIVATGVPLAGQVARDLFRVDLAYRLARLTIEVPALRDRREDLPLLVQGYINRFCHETGKRMQGITVKAMSALLAYDYPGNLAELENITRQLVYLCPPGQPIDANLLPERVRLSPVQGAAEIDATSDLDLDRLVANTERAAIKEALRRTHGIKSRAARVLGLSRNGLAMKMQRHGLKS